MLLSGRRATALLVPTRRGSVWNTPDVWGEPLAIEEPRAAANRRNNAGRQRGTARFNREQVLAPRVIRVSCLPAVLCTERTGPTVDPDEQPAGQASLNLGALAARTIYVFETFLSLAQALQAV